MYIVNNYTLAVIFCVVTMICWGSWGNTQKLAAKTWRYEYFYWDYVIGLLLFSILSAFTLGSVGSEGRSFLPDLAQADWSNIGSALLGGVVFNAANILLAAAIAICGLSVAFPVGIGLALVLGVLVNYFGAAKGAPLFIFIGVALIVVAIVLNGLAYRKMLTGSKKVPTKGIGISIAAGVIMAFFYRFVAASMDLTNFADPAPGKLTPYTAVFVFAVGVFASNFIFNTIAMKRPVGGADLDRRLFPGQCEDAPGRYLGRCDLVRRSVVQHDRFGTGRGCDFLRTGAGSHAGLRHVGYPGLERVQRRSESVRPTECLDVRSVYRRTRVPDLRGGLSGKLASKH